MLCHWQRDTEQDAYTFEWLGKLNLKNEVTSMSADQGNFTNTEEKLVKQ